MKEFIEYLVKNIVKEPEEFSVTEENNNGMALYTIKVDESDMGLVIGKEGKTIRSIRSLAKAKAIKDGVRIRIELWDYRQLNTQNDTEIDEQKEDSSKDDSEKIEDEKTEE
jgi:uncharacterized protein